jgi:hypothetical protein
MEQPIDLDTHNTDPEKDSKAMDDGKQQEQGSIVTMIDLFKLATELAIEDQARRMAAPEVFTPASRRAAMYQAGTVRRLR